MKMNRRSFTQLAIAGLTLGSTSACSAIRYITAERPATYRERVSSVLISEDDATLVVTTKKFHYIFTGPSPLSAALKGKLHPHLKAEISAFYVRQGGDTSGLVELTLANPPDEVLSEALGQGFTKTPEGAKFVMALVGKRYGAGDVPAIPRYMLNETYEVEVLAEQGLSVLKTPIYLVKGAFYIAGVALVVPLFYAVCVISPCATEEKRR